MAGKFGGIAVDETPSESQFGGVSVSEAPATIAAPIEKAPPSAEDVFAKQYIAEQKRPLLDKLLSAGGTATMLPLNAIKGLGETAFKGAQGYGELFGSAKTRRELTQNVDQSILEAIARPTYDVLNAVRQAIAAGADRPDQAALALGALTAPLAAPALGLLNLRSRTPSADEVSKAFKRELVNKAFEDVRKTPIAPEVFGKANIPLAEALPLAAAIPGAAEVAVNLGTKAVTGIGSTASRMASRGVFSAPLEDIVTKTLGITAQEGSADIVPVLKSRVLEATGKAPVTASEAIKAASQTEDFLIKKTVDALKVADKQGLQMSKDLMIQNAENAVKAAQPTIPQAELDAALQPFKDRLPDVITPSEGQKLLVEQNHFLDSVFGDTGVPARKTKGNAAVTARLGIADSLSNQLDDLYKIGSGLDESPYREWGVIRDAKNGLNDQIISAQKAQAGVEGSGKGIPVTKPGVARKVAKKIGRPFVAREIEAIDDGVRRIFKYGAKAPKAQAIDNAIKDELIQQYTPAIPVEAANLEASIQKAIKNLPKEYSGLSDKAKRQIGIQIVEGNTRPAP